MTFGSLFSGVGGLDLGVSRAGLDGRWQVELDPYARRVLAKHWPGVPRYGDIREIREGDLESVDLICGGFPCQPVSIAGHGRGAADPRWLWPEFVRILRLLRPRHVLVENVPGLLVRGMGGILGDLSVLGYDAEWSVVSACALGAPHTRSRVFLLAHADGERRDGWGGVGGAAGGSEPADGVGWSPEPRVDRVAHGIPHRVHRVRGLGNAVVPAVAELVARRLGGAR